MCSVRIPHAMNFSGSVFEVVTTSTKVLTHTNTKIYNNNKDCNEETQLVENRRLERYEVRLKLRNCDTIRPLTGETWEQLLNIRVL